MSDAVTLERPAPTLSRTLRIGVVPLLDAAPLVIADALGLFEGVGLRVALSTEPSWAAVRDKLAFGALDAAQLLGPMPIALAAGLGGVRAKVSVAAGLGANGNTVVLSRALLEQVGPFAPPLPGAALAAALRGRAPITLGVVFPFSSHNYLLRHWLAAAGIDPDRDLTLVSIPPPLMPQRLLEGAIDGFCAGEPWGSQAAALGAGGIALATRDVWPDHPEKLFAFAAGYAERAPEAAIGATAAVIAAARWLDDPANRAEAVRTLAAQLFPRLESATVAAALDGPAGLHFRAALLPRRGQAAWWLRQMRRWGHLPPGFADAEALAPWDDALWRAAAARLAEPLPATPSPPPGDHA